MNTITDPLQAQKLQAANIGLGNYQTASSAVPGLQGYYNQNFNQSPQQTLSNEDPLSKAVYGSVQQDISGGGGPFASLKQNLLGSFDTGQINAKNTLEQQLQSQGLLGSGAGMAVLGNQGVDAAQQRALLGSNVDVQELNLANLLGQQLLQNNQQQGFSNPMAALGMIGNLSSPPNFQDVNNTYYTPAPKSSGFQQGFADVLGAANAAGSIMSGMPSVGGPPSLGTTGTTPNYYMTNNGIGFPYQKPNTPFLNSPLTFSQ